MSRTTAEIDEITTTLEIDTSPERVWHALTEDIGRWWPSDFYTGGSTGSRNFVLEARPGGRMYEVWDDGGGVLWATVIGVEPNERLQVLGSLFPAWGGPSEWFGIWKLTADGDKTELGFTESSLGRITAEGLSEKKKGWDFIHQTLKAYVEKSEG